jgi:shikimate kinase
MIAQIFRDSGEPAFRQAEQAALEQVLEELRGGVAAVVALGGGAFVPQRNALLLRAAAAPTVFLDAPVEELWRRCRGQANIASAERPLLRSREQFRRLYETRRKSYLCASLKIDTTGRAVDAIAGEIADKLSLKRILMRSEQGESE